MDNFSWFVGFFEGEGSFNIAQESKAKGLSASSTDYDVLLKVQEIVGGNIYEEKRRNGKEHWKPSWKWKLSGKDSLALAKKMLPFLSERRKERCSYFIKLYEPTFIRQDQLESVKTQILSLRDRGMTLRAIGKQLNLDHGYVGKVIRQHKVNQTIAA